jgi:LAS superfamily LD-carboxypeptidase LdcB
VNLPKLMAYRAGQPIGFITVVQEDGVLMEAVTARAWREMKAASLADGVKLKVNSGFRSMEEQQKLYAEHLAGTRPTPVAVPGHSNHQNGIALDIEVHRSVTSPEYSWLAANAARFGFTNMGAHFRDPEYWHWERTGPAPEQTS